MTKPKTRSEDGPVWGTFSIQEKCLKSLFTKGCVNNDLRQVSGPGRGPETGPFSDFIFCCFDSWLRTERRRRRRRRRLQYVRSRKCGAFRFFPIVCRENEAAEDLAALSLAAAERKASDREAAKAQTPPFLGLPTASSARAAQSGEFLTKF